MPEQKPAHSFLTTKQLAEELQFSVEYIRTLAREGDIPCIVLPNRRGHYRFELSQVLAALTKDQRSG